MSISERDRHALDLIGSDLAASDPGLVGLLGAFTRLAAGEEMPAREQLRATWLHARRNARRTVSRRGRPVPAHVALQRLGLARGLMLLWLLFSLALISLAVALSSATTVSCSGAQGASCHQPTPGPPAQRLWP